MLKSETNTSTMDARILKAFKDSRYARDDNDYETNFEHGQWWVIETSTGAIWSVVDAVGLGAVDGFDFETVVESDWE